MKSTFSWFFMRVRKMRKGILTSSRLSFCLSVRFEQLRAPTGQIFMKLDIEYVLRSF
jgi:hypothetical protein